MDDDLAARVRKAQGAYEETRERVKASEQYGWWKERSSAFRFVVGTALAIVVVVSLVHWLA